MTIFNHFGQWCTDAVKTREYASKKAQLAAAELAKLSRRVCGGYSDFGFKVSFMVFIKPQLNLCRDIFVLEVMLPVESPWWISNSQPTKSSISFVSEINLDWGFIL